MILYPGTFCDSHRQGKALIRCRRGAFSLVEILVVLGILGVLLGILIPVISRAQAASRSVSCISNLRNIGHAFHLYATDNRMSLPDPGAVGLSWEQLLSPYYHGEFKCPSDEELFPSVGSSYDWRDTPDASSSLAGVSMAAVKRANLVLSFEALSGWHKKRKINVALFDGSCLTMDDDDCFADLDNTYDPALKRKLK